MFNECFVCVFTRVGGDPSDGRGNALDTDGHSVEFERGLDKLLECNIKAAELARVATGANGPEAGSSQDSDNNSKGLHRSIVVLSRSFFLLVVFLNLIDLMLFFFSDVKIINLSEKIWKKVYIFK